MKKLTGDDFLLSILSPSLLIASVGYFSAIISYKYFFEEGFPNHYSTYFLLLMFSLLLLSLWSVKEVFQKLKSLKFNFKVSWLLITLFYLGVGVMNTNQEFEERDIWLDEYTQFKLSTADRLKFSNIVTTAAKEQQPPLDYYLSSIGFTYFGWKEYAVRFHAIIFYFLTLITLSSFLYLRSKNLLITALGLTLYSVSHSLKYFSIEGRPVNLASFFGLLFLIEAIRYFDEDSEVKISIPLLLSIVLFSLSVGLQPITIIFLLSIILTILFYLSGEKKKAVAYFLHNAISALLISPILYHVYEISLELHQFVEPESTLSRVMKNFSLEAIFKMYSLQLMVSDIGKFLTAATIILLIAYIFLMRNSRKWLNISLATFLLLFPPYFFIIFQTIINWEFFAKYYICYTLISLTVCSLLLADVLNGKHIKRNLSLPFILILMSGSLYSLRDREGLANYSNDLVYTKKFYQYLGASDDINFALHFNFPKLGQWRGNLWVAEELYGTSNAIFHRHLFPFEYNFFVDWDKLPKGEFVRISLIEKMYKRLYKHSIQDFMKEVVPEHEVREFGLHRVYSFRKKRDSIKEFWKDFLKRLKSKLPDDYTYLFLETDITESIVKRDYEGCLKLIEEFKAINTKAFMDAGAEIDGATKIQELASYYRCDYALNGIRPVARNSNTPQD